MKRPAVIFLVVAAIVVGGLVYYLFFASEGGEAPSEPAPTAAPEAREPGEQEDADAVGEPDVELPPLEESDGFVRRRSRDLAAHPRLDDLLEPGGLVRRFVAVVDNVARGVSPRTHLQPLAPEERFQVAQRDGRTIIDPESYRRYDDEAELVASVDVESAVRQYRVLRPLFEDAYRELGAPMESFDRALKEALDRLLEVEVPEGPVEVVDKINRYEFADPSLESLPPAEKHLVRMGPENARTVKAKLRRLRALLETGP